MVCRVCESRFCLQLFFLLPLYVVDGFSYHIEFLFRPTCSWGWCFHHSQQQQHSVPPHKASPAIPKANKQRQDRGEDSLQIRSLQFTVGWAIVLCIAAKLNGTRRCLGDFKVFLFFSPPTLTLHYQHRDVLKVYILHFKFAHDHFHLFAWQGEALEIPSRYRFQSLFTLYHQYHNVLCDQEMHSRE